ncbi:MAG: glycosyl hydrolase 108 family protein, partial [Luteimonas sp.]
MSFEVAIERLLTHEGGLTLDSKDRGNWTSGVIGVGKLRGTKYGVSAMSYPTVDIARLTIDQAKAIYRRDCWDAVKGDELPPAVAFQAFDVAVNHGTDQAVRWLQRAAGVADDGVFGSVTLGAIKCACAADLILKFNSERLLFYTNLSTFGTFGKGWVRRVAA